MTPPAARPAAGGAPHVMLVYIVRRLLAAVVLLLIVTAATFVIFFVLPRLGGATVDDLASRYVGKSGSVEDIHAIAVKLGFTDPIWVQYGRFVGGAVRRRGLQHRPDHRALPRALPRLLVHQPEPGAARPARPAAGHAVARGGRRGAVAGGRGQRRSALGAAPRQRVRPGGDGRRARGRLAADLLHRPAVAGDLQLLAGHHRARRQLHAVRGEPAAVGVRPAPAVDHARVPLRGRATRG